MSAQQFDDVATKLNLASEDQVRERVVVIDKLAFQSAGIVSLSMTFVGYLLEDYRGVLATPLVEIPLYQYLFASWFLLAATLLLSLFVRWWSARHVVWAASSNFFETKLRILLEHVNLQEDRAGAKAAAKDSIDLLEGTTKDSKGEAKLSLQVRNALIVAAFTCYVTGFAGLLVTVAVTLQRIITAGC